MAKMPEVTLLPFVSDLVRADTLDGFYNVVAHWLPRLVKIDHYHHLFINASNNTFLMNSSPGFPTRIFQDYQSLSSPDLVLKLAMESKPGTCLHLGSLKNHPDAPEGWKDLQNLVEKKIAFRDSVSIVFFNEPAAGLGGGLTLWRTSSKPAFSSEEVGLIEKLGPLLATAFERLKRDVLLDLQHGFQQKLLHRTGLIAFTVDRMGVPLSPDTCPTGLIIELVGSRAERSTPQSRPRQLPIKAARKACQAQSRTQGERLPTVVTELLKKLIDVLERTPATGPVSEESVGWKQDHRIYIARGSVGFAGQHTYDVVFVRLEPYIDLSSLSAAGFSNKRIGVLDLFQRGLSAKEIAPVFSMSQNSAWYHVAEAGQKLGGVSGITHVLARATAHAKEMAIKMALTGGESPQEEPEDET